MKSVKIVVPIYRSELPELELKLLRHNLQQLKQFDIVLLMPISLEANGLLDVISSFNIGARIDVLRVSTEWLGKENGVKGYNKMMLSQSFYELFSDYEYVLICQTDAIIFKGDDLEWWCNRGYDYVGAPWFKEAKYNNPILKTFYALKHKFSSAKTPFSRVDILGKIGNGGLSLRRVKSHIDALNMHQEKAAEFIERSGHYIYNEDIFFAMIPSEFSYPTYEEAFKFSIDLKPKKSMAMLQKGELPFGCHALTQPKIYSYWQELLAKIL
ncbi:MAG: DUF5672 family protein [Rikenellaceae bacterium]